MRKYLLILSLCLFVMSIQNVFGQVTTASLSGVVRDATGNPIPGATVIALHTSSGSQYGATTNDDGRYLIPGMRIGGPYEVTIQSVGNTDKKENIGLLTLGETKSYNVDVSEVTTELSEVVVSGKKDPLMNSDRTGASTNIGNEQIRALPTLNRSLSDYTRLTPQSGGGSSSSFGGRNDRFNNFTVDGSAFNNAFGLSNSVGGQANANPISLDAIEEVQINLAPYDVRQAQFTGAGINAVTKAGTNEFKGSVYYFFRNQDLTGKRLGGVDIVQNEFSQNQYGFRVGGPIIKNKLFFFVNAESNRRIEPGSTFIARSPGVSGDNVSAVDASDLDGLKSFLINRYGFNPGDYQGYNALTSANNITARIDYNINNDHKLNVRYNFLQSFRDIAPSGSGAQGGRAPSRVTLPFSGSFYRINNNMNSVIAELNSRFGNKITNNFIIGYTAMRDFRESTSGFFPTVDIENGNNQNITTFGYEPFSPNNKLNTNIFQISNNLTYFKGKHTITAGFAFEFYQTENGFMPSFFGRYRFNTLQDFYASANGGVSNATLYELRYSVQPNNPVPLVKLRAAILGFYAQDEFQVNDYFKLTGGLRVDLPTYDNSVLPRNETVENMTFRDGEKIDVSKFAKTVPLFSPRIGFNWDVLKNQKLQIRGGSGVFTGRVPFVWISNQASNNGVIFNTESVFNPTNRPFTNSITPSWVPANPTAPTSFNLAATDPNFKIPQVWRTNIAVDYKMKNGWTATFEAIYGKDLNAVYYQNANLPDATGNVTGADNRPRYTINRINGAIASANDGAIMLRNNQQGYQLNITAQLQKTFSNGFFGMIAYNYGNARDLNSLSGASIAASAYGANQISGDPNAPILSYSSFMLQHRIIGSIGYEKEYAKRYKTSIAAFWEGRQGDRFSYTYGGDMNGDGFTNDLMYIPANRSDIILVPAGNATATAPADNRTGDILWQQLDAYIAQDPYLSANRGQYAARNGLVAPWYNRIDVRITQDISVFVGNSKKRNTLQISLDIFNVLNFVNSNWGVERVPIRTQLLSFQGYDPDGRPRYTFPYQDATRQQVMSTTFQNSTGLASRWQMQFGLRYIFN
ncbi:MAG: TonB-dependent receptor [Cytophagales bacterium]|nr:MAG: TonB-dependent receptor [Cytophagales bacterium]TAH30117.1 MAG: TonB-dependent receptor [Cytophagales bacterium]